MANYLGVNIKKILGKYVAPRVDSLIFYRAIPGERTDGRLTAGRNVEVVAYSCKGFVADYSEYDMANMLAKRGDKKIVIYADTLSVAPTADDYVVDKSGGWYTIVSVEEGASGAEYILKSRETSSRNVAILLQFTNELQWNIE
jgi:hypothetical protein